jgi:hypothetical protein
MTLGMSMGISGTTFPQSRYIRINVSGIIKLFLNIFFFILQHNRTHVELQSISGDGMQCISVNLNIMRTGFLVLRFHNRGISE